MDYLLIQLIQCNCQAHTFNFCENNDTNSYVSFTLLLLQIPTFTCFYFRIS